MMDFITDTAETNELLLLWEIGRAVGTAFDHRAAPMGLSRAQWKLISVLRRNPGVRQAVVAEILEIEPITLVRQLDRMEKAGWVERRPDPHDRRANQLFLTGKVAEIVTVMRQLSINLRSEILAGFTEEEHTVLVNALKRMKTNAATVLAEEDD